MTVVTVLITSHWQHAHHARNLFASLYFSRRNRKKPVVLSHTPTECYASPDKRSISFGFRLKMKMNVNCWLGSEDCRHKKCIWKERKVSPRLGRGSVLNWTLMCVFVCLYMSLCVYMCVYACQCVCVCGTVILLFIFAQWANIVQYAFFLQCYVSVYTHCLAQCVYATLCVLFKTPSQLEDQSALCICCCS